MPKFYVQSGNLKMVLHAHNRRGAALWAMHRSMSQLLPFLADDADVETPPPSPPVALAGKIVVSERGFDRPEGQPFDTFEIAVEWNQLLTALSRLERDMMTTAV